MKIQLQHLQFEYLLKTQKKELESRFKFYYNKIRDKIITMTLSQPSIMKILQLNIDVIYTTITQSDY